MSIADAGAKTTKCGMTDPLSSGPTTGPDFDLILVLDRSSSMAGRTF
jgi:hypothetical protein